ncbi:hypothetical protein JRO89_XS08G0206900 [Xanthoceras sorbifolium]|uniref:MRG domain-containing protein n=1 Tax=Xanthoceras sorbifolium TaxID=99658 RepID=A0ABQ8HQL2_9ROSI|nr:hypothetical protein JRO89_XS08G0206900 [Xanthoceras sorbifolium]
MAKRQLKAFSFLLILTLLLLLGSVSEARPFNILKLDGSKMRNKSFFDGLSLGAIKQSGPSPGVGNKFTDSTTLGGIKNSGPSPVIMGSSSNEDTASDGDSSSRDTPPPSNSILFSDGERVLAYHGPRIYEAKAIYLLILQVQKAELRKKEWRYYVHYLVSLPTSSPLVGVKIKLMISVPWILNVALTLMAWELEKLWLCSTGLEQSLLWYEHLANSWDEWVGADRLMKHTEENVMKQQALEKKLGVDKSSKTGRSAQTKQKSSNEAKVDKEDLKSNAAKGKKRKSDSGVEKDTLSVEKFVKIQIPAMLKKQLVDDCEFITQQDKLVKLPRSPNVDEILSKYLQYRSKKDGMMNDSIGEILKGIRSYFDKALPVMLLYKKERQQYDDVVLENVSPSTTYGAEHLLRLFVKLPELLAYINIEEETLTRMQQKMIDFLKFLQKNQSTFFLSAYDGSKVSDGKKPKGKMTNISTETALPSPSS